ncbi:MAG: MFS transporter [Actinobacteria bacterium]|nr:MFS transporter [Actinomycetota bacterium]
MKQSFEVFRVPKYPSFFAARFISNLGNGMGPIALAFAVLAMPDSTPTSLSLVLAAQAIPMVALLPLGGVIADRLGRARVIAITDVVLSAVVAAIGVLFLTNTATIPVVMALSFVAGCLNALWYPAFTGLAADVVPDEHLQGANAYISFASNSGLIIGTGVAGIIVATLGPSIAIIIDAATFLVAGILVFTFRHVSKRQPTEQSHLRDLVDGWKVFTSFRWIVVVVGAYSLILMVMRGAEEVVGPVLALEIYGGAAGWSLVLAGQSIGLLVGAVIASRFKPKRPMAFGALATGALVPYLLALAFASSLWVVVPLAFFWGVAMDAFYIVWLTEVQSRVPREALSRVMSYDAFGSLIFGPLGLALAGPLVVLIGIANTLFVGAAVCCAAVAAMLLAPSVRGLRALTTSKPL